MSFHANGAVAGVIDQSSAAPVPCLVIDDHMVMGGISLGLLQVLVPNPMQLDDKKQRAGLMVNPAMAEFIEWRDEIQRPFENKKKANLPVYADFIYEKLMAGEHLGTPPICLATPARLQVVIDESGHAKIGLPYDLKLLAVDGETQDGAWSLVNIKLHQAAKAGLIDEAVIGNIRVPIEIHHGIKKERMLELFYQRNVLGVGVNVNEALNKDPNDLATKITRTVMERVVTLPSGAAVPVATVVQTASRQIGKKSEQWVTLSGLRGLVTTTMHGRSGLQYGAKPVPRPEGVADLEAHESEVADVVHAILQRNARFFADRDRYLIGAPAMLAGIGVLANRTLTTQKYTSSYPPLTRGEMLARLDEVKWDKEPSTYWEGIGTRRTPSGKITVAGPKEVGYAVADAIEGDSNDLGAHASALRVRGVSDGAPGFNSAPAQSATPVPDQAPAGAVGGISGRPLVGVHQAQPGWPVTQPPLRQGGEFDPQPWGLDPRS